MLPRGHSNTGRYELIWKKEVEQAVPADVFGPGFGAVSYQEAMQDSFQAACKNERMCMPTTHFCPAT